MDSAIDYVRRIIPQTETTFVVPAPPPFPLSGASIDLWFADSQYYDGGTVPDPTGLLSISRASIGYAKNSDGTLTQFTTNTLRIGVGTGLLVEDTRTNLLRNSQIFTSTWGTVGVTPADNSIVAPDGTTTGGLLTESNLDERHIVYQDIVLSAGRHGLSVYAKAGTRSYVAVSIVGTKWYGQVFGLASGTIEGSFTIGSPTGTSATIEAMANGWYRCMITMDAAAEDTFFQIGLSNSANPSWLSGSPSYTGNSSTIYLWGAQLEFASFTSSYIPTTTTSAARAADVITITGNAQTDIASSTGSIVAWTNRGESAGFAANVVDSNGSNLLGFNASNNAIASLVATLTTGNTANRTSLDKLGLAWDGTGRSLVLNAGTVATDASAQTPSSTQHLGSNGSANFIYAYCERLVIWISKLSGSTIQGFTSL